MTDAEALIALGELDLAIARLERSLDELPEKRAILQLRHRLAEIEAVHAKADAYCECVGWMIARSTDETAAVTEKMDSEQAKILSGEITNPKELQNITREMDALGRKKSSLESETLALMEKAESAREQQAKIESTLEEGREKECELVERFKTKGGNLQTEIERLRARRHKLVATMDAALVERYERVRAAKHGIAVGVLEDGVCSACRTELPAGRAQELGDGPPIGECPNCRRILVVRRGA
jgi:hypothetical protein